MSLVAVSFAAGCGSAGGAELQMATRAQPTDHSSMSPSQPAAGSPQTGPDGPPANHARPGRTRVIVFSPFDRHGDLSTNLAVVLTTGATCQHSDVSVRGDAYRCFLDQPEADGSNVADPCFLNSRSTEPELACPVGASLSRVVKVVPSEAPPADARTSARSRVAYPWLIQLRDSQRCLDAPGAQSLLDGQRLNFTCDKGAVYGGLDRTRRRWTAAYLAKAGGTKKPSPTTVTIAWF